MYKVPKERKEPQHNPIVSEKSITVAAMDLCRGATEAGPAIIARDANSPLVNPRALNITIASTSELNAMGRTVPSMLQNNTRGKNARRSRVGTHMLWGVTQAIT